MSSGFLVVSYELQAALTPLEKLGIATVRILTGARHAHAGALGFRDFSSLSLAEENRRQLGNSACSIANHPRESTQSQRQYIHSL
jgi:hypothetical protein